MGVSSKPPSGPFFLLPNVSVFCGFGGSWSAPSKPPAFSGTSGACPFSASSGFASFTCAMAAMRNARW